MDPKLIKRINELAKKSKTIGLTEEEKLEQKKLREKYLELFRGNFKKQLNNTYVIDKNGNKIPCSKRIKH